MEYHLGRVRWPFLLLLMALGVNASIARVLILSGHSSPFRDAPRLTANRLFPAHAPELVRLEAHYARLSLVTLVHVVAPRRSRS